MERYGRIALGGDPYGVTIEGEQVRLLLDPPPALGHCKIPEEPGTFSSTEVTWLCPVAPSKIIGVGRNYRAHAAELGNEVPTTPLLFLKAPSALLPPGGHVLLPAISERVDFEGELAVVIASRTRHVDTKDALSHVFGYAPACDITARDLQKSDGQWTRAKGCDTFCPIGPTISSGLNANALELSLSVNGDLRQQASTDDMLFSVSELIAHISEAITLLAGDVILTGTPSGVGPLKPKDEVQVQIPPLDPLTFAVRAG